MFGKMGLGAIGKARSTIATSAGTDPKRREPPIASNHIPPLDGIIQDWYYWNPNPVGLSTSFNLANYPNVTQNSMQTPSTRPNQLT